MALRPVIVKQVTPLLQNPPEGIKVTLPDPNDMTKLDVEFIGPADTPYAGGHFHFLITLDAEKFPHQAPKVVFKTKIYHPNIEIATGEACIDIIQGDWRPNVKLTRVIDESIQLLKTPNPAHTIEPVIASQFTNDYPAFARTAQQWTQQYAT